MKKYIGIAVVLFVLAGLFRAGMKYVRQQQRKEVEYKRLLLEKDKTIRVYGGTYKKMVDDTRILKEITDKLRSDNAELATLLQKEKAKPVQIIETVIQVRGDTIIKVVPYKGPYENQFTLNYPEEGEPLVSTFVNIRDSTVQSIWGFAPLSLDVVISRGTNDLLQAYVNTNFDFIDISSIDVTQPPTKKLIQINPSYLSRYFTLGAGLDVSGKDYITGGVGASFGNNGVLLKANTLGAIELNYLRKW